MIHAGIYGATGYAGYELVKILCRHPEVTIAFATSHSFAGKQLNDIYAGAPALPLINGDSAELDTVDVVFLCLPHAASAPTAVKALEAGVRVVDLSADFRLDDADVYAKWYGLEHPAKELLNEGVYGLTEFSRETVKDARLVAVPGCYPTSVLMGVKPLLAANLVEGTVIADAKSGVSGAGRTPKQLTHFVEVADNMTPYKIGRNHRHLPEIEQEMLKTNPNAPKLIFTPQLISVPRGILTTLYVPVSAEYDTIHKALADQYADEPFITVLPQGQLATLAHVVRTNKVCISVTMADDDMAIVVVTEDNLLKGASGQAVQNMNLMFGLEETTALL